MTQGAFIFLVIMLQEVELVIKKCPPIITEKPKFSIDMKKALWLIDGRSSDLYCCMYGVDKIVWTFKKINSNESTNIEPKGSKYNFFDKNRTLEIVHPMLYIHTGYFSCTGIKNERILLSGMSYAKVVLKETKLNFIITQSSTKSMKVLSEKTSLIIFCVLLAFPAFDPQFRWIHVKKQNISLMKNGSLNESLRRTSLIYGYTGFSQLQIKNNGNDEDIYNFSLTLSSISSSNEGVYKCEISERNRTLEEVFHIYYPKIDKTSIFALIGTIGCIVFFALFIYVFKYDIKIYIKSILRILFYRNCRFKAYNFFFIYNYNDDGELNTIHNIVKYMRLQGYTSYFHHRDQKYGKDTFENLSESLKQSDLIVIWASTGLFKHNMYNFCVHMLINTFSNTKRVYVMTVDKKKIMKYCKSKTVIADLNSCLTTKTFFNYPSQEVENSATNIFIRWKNHKFLCWLISSLPLKTMKKPILY